MVATDLFDAFHRDLYMRVMERIEMRTSQLINGGAVQHAGETITTAEKYAAHTSYLKALSDVLEICRDIEKERYGAHGSRED